MRYLGEENDLMGIGYLGEVRLGADGHLYQWTEGIDGLGNYVGSWRRLRRLGRRIRKGIRRVARHALPIIQQVASSIPHPKAQAVAAGLTTATPLLRRAGLAETNGLGALYQAPDGALYQVEGLGQDEEMLGADEDELMQVMGIGYLGELRLGTDGHLYQWTERIDGLGNYVGSWRRLRRFGRRLRKGVRRVARQALPIIRQVAASIPHPQAQAVGAGAAAASPLLGRAGLAQYNGLGALYQAPDGAIYQVEGLGQDEELEGLAQDEELYGLAEDEAIEGFGEDEELDGLADDEEMDGMEGYLREDGVNGVEAYIKEEPPATRLFVRPSQAPEMWRPLW